LPLAIPPVSPTNSIVTPFSGHKDKDNWDADEQSFEGRLRLPR
jgi:hypothetical protein